MGMDEFQTRKTSGGAGRSRMDSFGKTLGVYWVHRHFPRCYLTTAPLSRLRPGQRASARSKLRRTRRPESQDGGFGIRWRTARLDQTTVPRMTPWIPVDSKGPHGAAEHVTGTVSMDSHNHLREVTPTPGFETFDRAGGLGHLWVFLSVLASDWRRSRVFTNDLKGERGSMGL